MEGCSKGTCDLILWGISAAMEFSYSVEEPLTSACLLYYILRCSMLILLLLLGVYEPSLILRDLPWNRDQSHD